MTLNILGPQAGNQVTTRPARAAGYGPNNTWYKACTTSSSNDGTVIDADALNDMLAQHRTAYTQLGIVQDDGDDMLARAIKSMLRFGVDTGAGSSTNTLTVTFTPPVTALVQGMCVIVKAAFAPSGTGSYAAALNANTLGAAPLTWANGNAVQDGDWAVGDDLFLVVNTVASVLTWEIVARVRGSAAVQHGQCYLAFAGGNLVLSPHNGNGIRINGTSYAIPNTGVILTSTGLTASTFYYVYAYVSAGVITLEAVTMGHATNSADGVEIKSGDASRTLVGAAYVNASGAFSDTSGARYVISWFNRKAKVSQSQSVNIISTASSVQIEVSTVYRNYFICWADDIIDYAVGGWVNVSGSPGYEAGGLAVGFDGAAAEMMTTVSVPGPGGSGYPASTGYKSGLAEGVAHYATLMAKFLGGGSMQLYGSSTVTSPWTSNDFNEGTTLQIKTRG